MHQRAATLAFPSLLLLLVACDGSSAHDAGVPGRDAGASDAAPAVDGGSSDDAGPEGMDAAPGDDAGDPGSDAGDPGSDAGDPGSDAGPSDAGPPGSDAGMSDAGPAAGDSGTFLMRRDTRRCAAPLCGGWWVSRVNHPMTMCHDGTLATECYVAGIYWDPSRFSSGASARAMSAVGGMLLTGTIASSSFPPSGVMLGELVVMGAWAAEWGVPESAPSTQRFDQLRDNGMRCLIPPCFNVAVSLLNTATTGTASSVDLNATGASPAQRADGDAAFSAGTLRVTGTITTDTVPGPGGAFGETYHATQFYLPIL